MRDGSSAILRRHKGSRLGRSRSGGFTGGMAHPGDHQQFLESGTAPAQVRSVVAESWIRSAAAGVDPDANLAPVAARSRRPGRVPLRAPARPGLPGAVGRARTGGARQRLRHGGRRRRRHPAVGVRPARRAARGPSRSTSSRAPPGTSTTPAPTRPAPRCTSTRPVQIRSAEHFNRLVQPWSCAAAPIHDPFTREILGLVDVTGGPDVASPQTLGMIRAAARLAESELARIATSQAPSGPPSASELWSPASVLHAAGARPARMPGQPRPPAPITSARGTARSWSRSSTIRTG